MYVYIICVIYHISYIYIYRLYYIYIYIYYNIKKRNISGWLAGWLLASFCMQGWLLACWAGMAGWVGFVAGLAGLWASWLAAGLRWLD